MAALLAFYIITAELGVNWHTDPNRYSDDEVYAKLMEYYEYYYNKYNVNTNRNG